MDKPLADAPSSAPDAPATEPVRSTRTLLVTGFGAFPGSPRNPTETISRELARHAPRLARLGVRLQCATLAVRYEDLAGLLAHLAQRHHPDMIVHLGVAGRRSRISIETRAVNRAHPLKPDAARHRPAQVLRPGGPGVLAATWSAHRVRASLRAAGFDAEISRDAGDYVCNATLYLSLALRLAPCVGFIHVPQVRARRARPSRRSATHDHLVRAVLAAILAMARGPKLFRSAGDHAPSIVSVATDTIADVSIASSSSSIVRAGVR